MELVIVQQPKGGLVPGNGQMSLRQARAFLTSETSKSAATKPHTFTGPNGAGGLKPPKEFLIAFTKLSFFDIGCEGCGTWYKNAPDKKFPNPCMGKCQYEGHPALNLKYKEGIKWKHPGFCCSWKGMLDKDIPAVTLARLQKYQTQKREREAHA